MLATTTWSSHSLTHNSIHISYWFLIYHIMGPLPLELQKLSGLTHFKSDDYWEYTLTTINGEFSPIDYASHLLRLLSWHYENDQ